MSTNRRGFLTAAAALAAAEPALAAAAAPAAGRPGDFLAAGRKLTLASIRTANGAGLGVRTARGVLDVQAAATRARLSPPRTTDDFVNGRGSLADLMRLVEAANRGDASLAGALVPEARARFEPLLADPEKIICVGLNYRAHAAESRQEVPKAPVLFNKYRTALNAHGGVIDISREHATKFDYEAELVIVVGRTARDVPESQALDYVLGYCSGQDFSARDLQHLTSQWMLGKTTDGSGPLGPWLVGADLVDPDNLDIQCLVNGEVRQSANTREMIFNCRQLVSFSSRHMTLKAGDVIFTGTPEGVISGYPADKQVWLKKGDKVVTRIQSLGDLEVTLV